MLLLYIVYKIDVGGIYMSSRIFGYGRVSSKDQNEAQQFKGF